jgi:hypothetical protein
MYYSKVNEKLYFQLDYIVTKSTDKCAWYTTEQNSAPITSFLCLQPQVRRRGQELEEQKRTAMGNLQVSRQWKGVGQEKGVTKMKVGPKLYYEAPSSPKDQILFSCLGSMGAGRGREIIANSQLYFTGY